MIRRNHGLFALIAVFSALWLVALLMLVSDQARAAYITDPTCTQEIGTWQQMTASPNPHIEGASAVVGGKLYMATGFASYSDTLYPSNRVTMYDPMTDTWSASPKATPIEASHIQGATDGRYIWTVGGFIGPHPGTATTQVWRYDTQTDTWSAAPPLPEPRASGGAVILGRQLHYISGLSSDRQTDEDDHWVLNLDNPTAWQRVATFPRPRNHFQAVALEGKIYAVGGQFGHDGPHEDVAMLDVYDPTTGEWQALADLPGSRSHAEMGTFVINERIIIVGGRSNEDGSNPVNTVLEYNPQRDRWSQIATLPEDLISPTANVVNDMLVVTNGGVNWYTPQQSTWIAPITDPCAYPKPADLQTEGSLTQPPVRPEFDFSAPQFDDGSTAQASWYQLVVANAAGGTVISQWYDAEQICSGAACTVRPSADLLPVGFINGAYSWAVRSWHDGRTTDFSDVAQFTVDVFAPALFNNVAVDTNTGRPIININRDPNTTWYNISITGANYRYQAWYDVSQASCDATSCALSPAANPPNGSYTVYLQGWGPGGYVGGGVANWEGPFAFQLDLAAPPAVTGLEFSAEPNWNAAEGATWYQVWLGSPDYTQTAYNEWHSAAELGCAGGGSCAAPMLPDVVQSGARYSWFVRPWGPGGYGPWAALEDFPAP